MYIYRYILKIIKIIKRNKIINKKKKTNDNEKKLWFIVFFFKFIRFFQITFLGHYRYHGLPMS